MTFPTPSLGPLTEHEPIERCATHVDYDGILAAVGGLPLVGNQEGLIPAFGVVLTRHFANYYNRISFEFLRRVGERFGEEGREAATDLLVEAGRVCAFNTFGGIMTSTEWDALIRPTLTSSADWVHGIVAVVEAFGWGRWHVTSVDDDEAEFVIQDDYESVGWLSAYGPAEGNVAFLHHGGVEGLMNLVHLAQIADKPTLDQRLYDRVFRDPSGFRAECTASRAAGAPFTRFRVRRRG